MKICISNTNIGIAWVDGKCLKDLHCADDIALLCDTPKKLQPKIDNLAKIAGEAGVSIIYAKTNMLDAQTSSSNITWESKNMKIVEQFTNLGSWRPQEGSDIKDRKGIHHFC